MLVIRLRRAGSTTPRDGRFVEVLGHYNPRTQPETLEIDRERLAHWLKNGALPSDTVRTLVDRQPAPAAEAAPAESAAPAGEAAPAQS
jgi:ribosomal protein S16